MNRNTKLQRNRLKANWERIVGNYWARRCGSRKSKPKPKTKAYYKAQARAKNDYD